MKICNESRHIKQTLHTTSLSFWAQNRFGSVRPSVRRELWYGQLLLQFKWESSNTLHACLLQYEASHIIIMSALYMYKFI
jgi:hypothetical protein